MKSILLFNFLGPEMVLIAILLIILLIIKVFANSSKIKKIEKDNEYLRNRLDNLTDKKYNH